MKLRNIKIVIVMLGLITLSCSTLMSAVMTTMFFVMTPQTFMLLVIMMCGFLMVVAGVTLQDKYTTYDELQKMEKK